MNDEIVKLHKDLNRFFKLKKPGKSILEDKDKQNTFKESLKKITLARKAFSAFKRLSSKLTTGMRSLVKNN